MTSPARPASGLDLAGLHLEGRYESKSARRWAGFRRVPGQRPHQLGVFQPVCVVVAVGVEVPVEEGLVANVASIVEDLRDNREKLEKSAGSNRRPMI